MPTARTSYKIEQGYRYEDDNWWSWWIWIEANESHLNQIEHVTYTLHPTFRNPVRKVTNRRNKFKLETEGWGTFAIYAKVQLKNGENVDLEHQLYLAYPDGTENLD